jgi:hypothetical protein
LPASSRAAPSSTRSIAHCNLLVNFMAPSIGASMTCATARVVTAPVHHH